MTTRVPEQPHRGEFVILRAYADKPLLRRIWEIDTIGITALSEDRYQRALLEGEVNDMALRWPFVFCYHYSEDDWKTAELCYLLNQPFWESLTQYDF